MKFWLTLLGILFSLSFAYQLGQDRGMVKGWEARAEMEEQRREELCKALYDCKDKPPKTIYMQEWGE